MTDQNPRRRVACSDAFRRLPAHRVQTKSREHHVHRSFTAASPSSKRETVVSCAPTPSPQTRAGGGSVFSHAAKATPSLAPNASGGVCFPSPSDSVTPTVSPAPAPPCVDTTAPPTFYTLLPDVRHPAPASPSPFPASASLCAPLSSAPVAATRCVCTPGPCVCAVAPVNAPPVCLCPLPTDRHPRLPARPHRPLRLRACLHPLPLPRIRAEGFVLCTF